MSTARGRLWKRMVESGRWSKQDLIEKIGSAPKRQDIVDALEAIGVEAPPGATNQELYDLLQNA